MRKTTLVITVIALVLSLGICMVACSNTDLSKVVISDEVKAQDATLTEGTDVRVMSYNIQVGAWGGAKRGKPNERAERYEQVIAYFQPDVIGLQEVDENWHMNMSSALRKNYKVIFNGLFDYTSLAYNVNKVELLEHGKLKYSKYHEAVIRMMRYAAWGVFKDKETGKEFIVTSTHLDFHPHEEAMKIQIKELGDFIKAKSEEHNNCPIFATGDYNVQEKVTEDQANCNELYKTIAPTTGLVDANYIDGIQIQDGEKCKWNDAKWDKIFVNKSESIKKFGILSDAFYEKISDHYPIFVDAVL